MIIVGTHGDLITDKTKQNQNLQLIERLYGSLSHKVEGVCTFMCVCVCVCVCACLSVCCDIV